MSAFISIREIEYYFFQYDDSATILLFARRQHYNADDFSDEPDFIIVYQSNIAN